VLCGYQIERQPARLASWSRHSPEAFGGDNFEIKPHNRFLDKPQLAEEKSSKRFDAKKEFQ